MYTTAQRIYENTLSAEKGVSTAINLGLLKLGRFLMQRF